MSIVWGLALLAGALPAVASTVPVASPAPVVLLAAPKAGTVFNNSKGTKAAQLAIITQINTGIDAALPGSTIRMAQYLFDLDSTANKLVAAFRRGVHVQVLVDDGEQTPQITLLRAKLGRDKLKPSFVATCRHSCMSDGASVMHAKFYLFSQAGSAKLVSMVSSANPYTGNTFKSWNDIHTIVGDQKIYASLDRYFTDMLLDQTNLNYYRTTTSGKYKLYLFPRGEQPGVNTVALLDVLGHVRCYGAAPGYSRTRVRIAQWGWTSARLDLARKLWELHNRGCKVQVIYNSGVTSRSVTAALLKPSPTYGMIPVYDAWVDKNNDGHAGLYAHHKLLTINGVWFGHPNTKVTYTGSQNLTGPATRVNNDVILRILDDATHDAYVHNMSFARDRYTKRVTQLPPLVVPSSRARINTLANQDGGL